MRASLADETAVCPLWTDEGRALLPPHSEQIELTLHLSAASANFPGDEAGIDQAALAVLVDDGHPAVDR